MPPELHGWNFRHAQVTQASDQVGYAVVDGSAATTCRRITVIGKLPTAGHDTGHGSINTPPPRARQTGLHETRSGSQVPKLSRLPTRADALGLGDCSYVRGTARYGAVRGWRVRCDTFRQQLAE